MTVESVTYISDLNATYPDGSDAKSEGDDHIRNLKTGIKTTFPNISGAVTATHTELNYVDVTAAGTAEASKALILGANKNVDTLVIADGGLKLGAGAGTAVTATAAELNYCDVTTPGTAEASKAVILDANKDITSLGDIGFSGTITNTHIGIGADPVSWSTGNSIDLVSGAILGNSTESYWVNNLYYNAGWKYKANGLAVYCEANASGSFSIQTAPNNVSGAGAAATLTERMTLDVSGNLSADGRLITNSAATGIVSIGASSLNALTSGADNVAVGKETMLSATTCNYNVAIGTQSLYSTVTGAQNVAVGYLSLRNTTSSNNVAIGYTAGQGNTTGDSNTAIGSVALNSNSTGSGNTAVGYLAVQVSTASNNTGIGSSSLQATTTGAGNTAVGQSSGVSVTTGANNTFVGKDSGGSFATGSNSAGFGYSATPSSTSASNEITLGNSSIATLRCQVTTITALSDERDKKNIEDLNLGLDFINALTPRKFTWNMRDGAKVDIDEAGFIAQELDGVSNKFDADWVGLVYKENPERLEASPGKLIPILVKAVQELSEEVARLKQNLAAINNVNYKIQ